jgi:hypothetical protein
MSPCLPALCGAHTLYVQASLKEFLSVTMADMRQPLSCLQAASALLTQQPCVQRDEEASFLVAAVSAASHMLSGARRQPGAVRHNTPLSELPSAGLVANVLSFRSLEARCRYAQ